MPTQLQSKMPDAWRIFFRNRELRPIQEAAIPPLLQGKSILISSPTASGKTEACFAPLYQRHVSFARSLLSVVYIAPTKALVNDMMGRLLEYFGHASEDAIKRYTGDRHEFDSPDGAFVLLCSPEALDSLQLTRPNLLTGVRAIVFDELHFLHGTARGQQARAVVHRLQRQAATRSDSRDVFQRVGLTATVDDPEGVAKLWLGDEATAVHVAGARDIELSYLDATGIGTAQSIFDAVVHSDCRKVLVFSNTRNGAHALANNLSTLLQAEGWPVYLHIGVMAAGEREQVETAIRRDSRALCVATSTLELGIDIGDVDAVVLAQPPVTINAFLQRIGRGNRRSDKCQVWAVVEDASQKDLYRALHHCGVRGFLDDAHEYQRHSVEFQQAISFAWEWARREQGLTRQNLKDILGDHVAADTVDDMIACGALRKVGDALIPNQIWMDQGDQRRIHTVLAAPAGVPIVDLHSGETVGTTRRNTQASGRLFTGTRVREIRAADESGFYLGPSRQSHQDLAKLPTGRRRSLGLPRRLVWALAELDGIDPRVWQFGKNTLTTWGGGDFNHFVKEVLVALGYAPALEADSYGISGLDSLPCKTPADLKPLLEKAVTGRKVKLAAANSFREPTAYHRHLGTRLQAEDGYRSMPLSSCLRWLDECISITISA